MLNKQHRLNSREFSQVFSQGQAKHSESFMVKYVRADDAKAAVGVSKKHAKTAVARNRMRRRIYGALRGCLSVESRLWCVVIVKQHAWDKTYQELETELCELVQRLK